MQFNANRQHVHNSRRSPHDLIVDTKFSHTEFPWCEGIGSHPLAIFCFHLRLIAKLTLYLILYDRSLSCRQ